MQFIIIDYAIFTELTVKNFKKRCPDEFYPFQNSILFYIMSKSKPCQNCHGAMKRCHIKQTKDKIQS